MALDERYITNTSLNQYLVNKDTGLPLSNGTLTFYRDLSRNTLKPIYQLTGSPPNYSYTALPNPLTLSSVGTIQNAGGDNEMLYYYPYDDEGNLDLYYIVAKDSGGNTQFTREAFPNIAATADPSDDIASVTNQLSNPQFSRVFTNEGLTTSYAVSGSALTFEFAPDWVFEIEGTGTVTVSRTAVSGTLGIPTSPSYYITVTVPAGVTSCKLRQRLYYNSGLWATTADQDMSLACVLVGRNELAGNAALSIFYKESTSTDAPTEILAGTVAPGAWTVLKDSNQIPTSTNTDTGSSAYVDIYVAFPLNSSTSITSIQVVPVASDDVVNLLDYDQESSNREQALMGDYFIPNLEAKQIPSLLTGWDFSVNPAQWGSTGTLASTPALASYIWDQTIAIDTSNNATYARNGDTGGLQFTTVGASGAIGMVQFLDGLAVKKILGTKLSVNVFGYRTAAGAAVTMRVYLYRATNAAAFPSLAANQFIATLNTSGTLTVPFTGWTEINRNGLPIATATLNSIATLANVNDAANNYGFNNWEITDATQIDDTEKFAIAVTFAYTAASTVIVVNSVSCVPGNIPCRPGIQKANEVLADCRYYYQKSFNIGTAAAQSVGQNTGESVMPMTIIAPNLNIFSTIVFPVNMRVAPAITTYNPVAANAFVRNYTAASDATSTTAVNITPRAFYVTFEPSSGNPGGTNAIHWQADARLGL